MGQLYFQNLRLALILCVVYVALALLAKSSGGFLLFGGFWVVFFGSVCWRTAVTFGVAIGANCRHRSNIDLVLMKLIGLLFGVMLAQIVLNTLGVFFLDGNEVAIKALFFFVGVTGSTSLLVPVYFWFRSHDWLQSVVALLLSAGLYFWWEVFRNLWPDKLLMGSVIGMSTFTLSMLLTRPALDREYNRKQSD